MSNFLRFLFTDGEPPTLAEIDQGLSAINSAYSLDADLSEPTFGDLYYEDKLLAELEINTPGDDVFEDDVADMVEELQKHDDPNREIPLQALAKATGMVAIHLKRAGYENYELVQPLLGWLFDHRNGLLQIDLDGFYDHEKRIVSLL
ncbi:MAG: hypothetical protein IAE89_06875 [Anaerolineae bacterium]|nr:hypothetical protein [Anaerolineae bacterium]